MIVDKLSNGKRCPIVTELLIWGRKLNISLAFITQSYFAVPRYISLNSTHYFIMKIQSKWELQQTAFNHSLDIEFKDFVNLWKNALQNHILFWLQMLLLHQIIFYVTERIFKKNVGWKITMWH